MNTAIVILALIMAIGVIATFVTVVLWPQMAEAQRGCPLDTPAPNAAKGRCFRGL